MNTDTELPEGWTAATLDDGLALSIQPGFACGGSNRDGTGIPHLRPMNVSADGCISLEDVKFVPATEAKREERLLRKGDVLFNNTNSPALVGKTALYHDDEPRAFSNHMTRVRTQAEVLDPQFCAHFLHHLWGAQHFEKVCNNHVGQSSISRSVLAETPIPLPPVAEQRRIVAAVEAVLAKVSAARERLNRVPAILKRFRQSVLSAACSGRLTADWRAQNPNAEPASVLLERITTERTSSAQKKVAEEESNDIEFQTPDVPESWVPARVAELLHYTRSAGYGVLQPGEDLRDGVPMVRVCDIENGTVRVEELKRIAPNIDSQYARTRLEGGEVLVTLVGTIGRVGVAPQAVRGANIARAVAMLPLCPHVLADYLHFALTEPEKNLELNELAREVARKTLNLGLLKAVRVPLPPLAEQREIVARVSALFARADAIEARLTAARTAADRLTQAVLAKAFRGELVPTEAELARRENRTYEPASELLARVRAAREQHAAKPPRAPKLNPKTAKRNRTLALAYFTSRQPEAEKLNRTRAVKQLSFVQWHFGVPLGLAPARGERGPYDPVIEEIETDAKATGFVETFRKPKGGDGFAVRYKAGPKCDTACKKARALFDEQLPALDTFLARTFELSTDEVELFGTVYAAWNDLLLDARPTDDAAIVAEVHQWHASKPDKFPESAVRDMLERIREWDYVPTGTAPRTRPA